MAFNPMDFFTAGSQLGQAQVSPFSYGANNLMEQFNRMQQLGMQMQLQSGLFKAEHQWDFENDPVKRQQALKNWQQGIGPKPSFVGDNAPGFSIGGGGAFSSSVETGTPRGATISEDGMVPATAEEGVYSLKNPSLPAREELFKQKMEQSTIMKGFLSRAIPHLGSLKAYEQMQGGSGPIPTAFSKLARGNPQVAVPTAGLESSWNDLAFGVGAVLQHGQGFAKMLGTLKQTVSGQYNDPITAHKEALNRTGLGLLGVDMATQLAKVGDARYADLRGDLSKVPMSRLTQIFNDPSLLTQQDAEDWRNYLDKIYNETTPKMEIYPGEGARSVEQADIHKDIAPIVAPLAKYRIVSDLFGKGAGYYNQQPQSNLHKAARKVVDIKQDGAGNIRKYYSDGTHEDIKE